MGDLFGTDGVRGVANLELTPELAMALSRAAATVVASGGRRPRFLVGRDTRLSGDLLEAAVAAGLCSAGADAVLGGVMPTPALAYLVSALSLDSGIMVSASHNPYQYNGLKLLGPGGEKLSEQQEARVGALAAHCPPSGSGRSVGRVQRASGILARYAAHLTGSACGRLQGLRVVADCAHGALHELAPQVLASLGAQVVALNCSPDGANINQGGALHPQALARAVQEQNADAGLAFDGDGDRVVLVDETGAVVDGDQILAIWAQHLSASARLANGMVVGTVISNGGLERFLESIGCRLARAPVGDRHVAEEMGRRGAILGGETCGHVIFRPHLTSADGLFAGLALLRLVAGTGQRLSELAGVIRKRPQVMINVPVADHREWKSDLAVRAVISQAECALDHGGWLVVRASGTEPVIRVTAECDDEFEARAIAEQVAAVIEERMGVRDGSPVVAASQGHHSWQLASGLTPPQHPGRSSPAHRASRSRAHQE